MAQVAHYPTMVLLQNSVLSIETRDIGNMVDVLISTLSNQSVPLSADASAWIVNRIGTSKNDMNNRSGHKVSVEHKRSIAGEHYQFTFDVMRQSDVAVAKTLTKFIANLLFGFIVDDSSEPGLSQHFPRANAVKLVVGLLNRDRAEALQALHGTEVQRPAGVLIRRQFSNTISAAIETVLSKPLSARVGYWRKTFDEMTKVTMERKYTRCLTNLRTLKTQNAQRNVQFTEDSLRDMFIGTAREMRRELGASDNLVIVRGKTELAQEFRRGANKADNCFGNQSQAGYLWVSNSDDRDKIYAIYSVLSPYLKALYDGLPEEGIRQCMMAILMVDRNKFEDDLLVADDTSEN